MHCSFLSLKLYVCGNSMINKRESSGSLAAFFCMESPTSAVWIEVQVELQLCGEGGGEILKHNDSFKIKL